MYALPDLEGNPERVMAWYHHGLPLAARLVSADAVANLAHRPGAKVVVDAGLTEIAPGTVTAVVLPTR